MRVRATVSGRSTRLTPIIAIAGVTLIAHVLLFLQTSQLTRIPGFVLHPPGFEERMLESLKQVKNKLDGLVAGAIASGDCAPTTSLEEVRAELGVALGEWVENRRAVTGSRSEASYSHQRGQFRGDAVFAETEVERKVNAVIESSKKGTILGLEGRPKINMLVGVITGFNPPGVQISEVPEKYDYRKRRKALRETWFPTEDERTRLETTKGIVVRFIVGHSTDWIQERAMAREEKANRDIIRLPITEAYTGLTNKTKMFITTAAALYDADWYVKVDDDVYLMVDRLHLAAKQWARMGAGYIGCMKHGPVLKDKKSKWYEPQHLLLGNGYYLHAYGSIYVLSSSSAQFVVKNFHNLRMLYSEALTFFNLPDTAMGAWMLASNVVHFEDMRLCMSKCSPAAVGLLRNECAGLCNPLKDLHMAYNARSCRFPSEDPLPYEKSFWGHRAFDKMHV